MAKKILLAVMAGAVLLLANCVITARATTPRVTVYHEDPPPPKPHVTVTVHTPPAIVVDDDPEMVVIPGTYVYWLDGHDDVYFYDGYWWRAWDGGWYRSEVYSGPWVVIQAVHVPHSVRYLPPDWRHKHYDAPRVRWYETRKSWKSWEHDKHWEKRKWKKEPLRKGHP